MSGRRDDHLSHRDSDEWASGQEEMTAAQESYLERLCQQTGTRIDYDLTKSQAAARIEELKELLDNPSPSRPLRTPRSSGPPRG